MKRGGSESERCYVHKAEVTRPHLCTTRMEQASDHVLFFLFCFFRFGITKCSQKWPGLVFLCHHHIRVKRQVVLLFLLRQKTSTSVAEVLACVSLHLEQSYKGANVVK